jgi:uroporphyrin-III C-methyltransferase
VALVGAGPGDPELLTVRALHRIEAADAIVYDCLVGSDILKLARKDARLVYVGKQSGRHTLPQECINALLVELACEGLNVVRLKGGDPFIFGRGGEEAEELAAHGIPCEVVPGITAAAGAGAAAGIPLTHRDHAQALVFVTGHLKCRGEALDWVALARPRQTLVFYMGLGNLRHIVAQLTTHGLDPATPAAVVASATLPQQRRVIAPLAELELAVAEAGVKAPALIIVGGVVSVAEELESLLRMSEVGTGA